MCGYSLTLGWSIFIINSLLSSAAESQQELKYAFGECVNNTRSLYYYYDEPLNCNVLSGNLTVYKPPVQGLRCDLTCERGYYLGVNLTSSPPSSGCKKCEEGKYSLGGGILFSQVTNAWRDPLPIQIFTDCSARSFLTGHWENNCKPWKVSDDGSMISSGNNSEVLETYGASRLFSTLRITATFVRPGHLTYLYRVEAEEPYDGLLFEIDDVAKGSIVSNSNGWVEVTHEIPQGTHTMVWDYTKDFSGDYKADRADIKVIELVGTSYSDTTCHPCSGSVTMSGGAICGFCKENEYAAPKSESELDFKCYSCPNNTFAPKGSVGEDSCISLHACTSSDLLESYTKCVNGRRSVSYSWSEPQTCKPDLPKSISLPATKHNLRCDFCNPGYYYSGKAHACITCTEGKYLAIDSNGTENCAVCDGDRVVVRQIDFGLGTHGGWTEWPSIVNKQAATSAGWKLTQDGIVLVPETRKKNKRGLHAKTRFELHAGVVFTFPGYLNVTYELSNMPTDESAGAAFQLEFTVARNKEKQKSPPKDVANSDDFHAMKSEKSAQSNQVPAVNTMVFPFKDGTKNGKFSEVIPINAAETTPVNITFVLHASTEEAIRYSSAKITYMSFMGVQEGGAVACVACPPGSEPFTDEKTSKLQCRLCDAGTFSGPNDEKCTLCPKDTFSRAGSDKCSPCGSNTYSSEGSAFCSAPSIIAAASSNNILYNISLLQSLSFGNFTSLRKDTEQFDEQPEADPIPDVPDLQNVSLGYAFPRKVLKIAPEYWMISGLFRPIGDAWHDNIAGQIIEDDTDMVFARPYMMYFEIQNSKEAAGTFMQTSGRYGRAECSIPPRMNVWNGGSVLNIYAKEDGSGLTLKYVNGSRCKESAAFIQTRIELICDPHSKGNEVRALEGEEENACNVALAWRTPFACPICQHSFFSEYKTACTGGQQSVTFSNQLACYGGDQRTTIPIKMCNEMVLDSTAIRHVYFGIALIGILVLVLLISVYTVYRKYRATYDDYMYLKGKIPSTTTKDADGNNETVFEFSNGPAQDTPNSETSENDQDEENHGDKAQLQAV